MATFANDAAPSLVAAGTMKKPSGGEKVADCLEFEERPPTPEHMKRFRKSFKGQPGTRVKHWGLANDETKPADFTYGVEYNSKMLQNDVLGVHEPTPVQEFLQERSESIFASRAREPLGSSVQRGHVLPDKTNSPDFKFGVQTEKGASARTLICPPSGSAMMGTTSSALREQYKRSHAAFDPGEQARRNYSWPKGVDPDSYSFGGVQKEAYVNGVGKALDQNKEFDSGVAPTQTMPKTVSDFNEHSKDVLGRPLNLGLGSRNVAEDHVFGMPSAKVQDWDARKCIEGDYSYEEQLPEADLGRPVLRGAAPLETLQDYTRSYGTPSVRNDIVPPKMRSVADNQNYGDEPDTKSLLFPQPYCDRNVSNDDFIAARGDDELKEIALEAGLVSDEDGFAAALAAAKAATGTDSVSINDLRAAVLNRA